MSPPCRPRPTARFGRAEGGVVVTDSLAATMRVLAVGPSKASGELSPAFVDHARSAIDASILGVVPQDVPSSEAERMLRSFDADVRSHWVDPTDPTRATAIALVFRGETLWIAHTGDAAAILVRDGHAEDLLEPLGRTPSARARRERTRSRRLVSDTRKPPPEVPWIGQRAAADSEQPLFLTQGDITGWTLREGDRLVICTAPVPASEQQDLLASVEAEDPDLAAQSVADILRLKASRHDVGVVVIDWMVSEPRRPESLDVPGDLGAELFAGFQDLIREITDEMDLADHDTPDIAMRISESVIVEEGELVDLDDAAAVVPPGVGVDLDDEPTEGGDEVERELEAVHPPQRPTLEPMEAALFRDAPSRPPASAPVAAEPAPEAVDAPAPVDAPNRPASSDADAPLAPVPATGGGSAAAAAGVAAGGVMLVGGGAVVLAIVVAIAAFAMS